MANRPKPLLLLITDGFGPRKERDNNVIARTPTLYRDSLQQNHPITALDRSGDVLGTKLLLDGGNLAVLKQTTEMTGRSLIG